ncbi:MAG: glycosyltransferase family 4 protein [Candidatus Helarchaeota archaeon]
MNLALLIRGLFPEKVGGQEIYGYLLLKNLIKLNQNLIVFTLGTLKINKKRLKIKSLRLLNIPVVRFLYKSLWYFFSFLRVHKNLNINLVHTNGTISEGFAALLIKKLFGVPIVTTLHGGGIYSFAKKLPFLVKSILKNSDSVIAINNYLKHLANQYFSNKIEIIPNFIDSKKFMRVNEDSIIELKKKYELTDDIFILSVARLVPTKNIRTLIRIIQKITKTHPNVFLMIIGDGPEKNKLMKLAKSLKLEEKVRFLGKISNERLPLYYSACDIFALPSLYEGQPTVILEAMACEAPIISYSVGGISELIKQGYNGFLVPKNDDEMLKNKIIELISNQELRKNMGKNSRRIIEDKFDSTKNSKKIFKIYLKTVKKCLSG